MVMELFPISFFYKLIYFFGEFFYVRHGLN